MTKTTKYKIKLEIGDKTFKSEHADLLECFNGLGVDKFELTTFGKFFISKGNKKVDKLMYVRQLRRFFMSDLAKVVQIKMWTQILNNG